MPYASAWSCRLQTWSSTDVWCFWTRNPPAHFRVGVWRSLLRMAQALGAPVGTQFSGCIRMQADVMHARRRVCSQLCNDRGPWGSAVHVCACQIWSVGRLHPTLGMRPASPQVCECKCQPAAFANGLPVSNQPGTFDERVLIAGANTRRLYSAAFVSLLVLLCWRRWLSV